MIQDVRPKTGGEERTTQPLGFGVGALDTGVRQALARNFAKKVANSKKVNEEAKESVTQLRNEFLIYLAKVYDNATKKEGVLGCHRIIQRNCDNPSVLRVVLGALCDRSS